MASGARCAPSGNLGCRTGHDGLQRAGLGSVNFVGLRRLGLLRDRVKAIESVLTRTFCDRKLLPTETGSSDSSAGSRPTPPTRMGEIAPYTLHRRLWHRHLLEVASFRRKHMRCWLQARELRPRRSNEEACISDAARRQ